MSTVHSLINAQNLGYTYGLHKVFSDINLSIEREEIVCLIGASGCGKSTLLNLLSGLESTKEGAILFNGVRQQVKAHASVVFQNPTLLPWLTVQQNVGFGLNFNNRDRLSRTATETRISAAIKQVGLDAHRHKKPAQLSGGMAQRVALARALARDPSIVFLDEPFSALDAITRESTQDLLIDLVHQQKSAALLVTHDIDEALRIADRVLLLAGSPAVIAGEWRPKGSAPRQHRTHELNQLREDILHRLALKKAA